MSAGWIKVSRCLFNSAVWRDCTPVQNRILMTLMSKAAYKNETRIIAGHAITLKKGQFATTLKHLTELCQCEEVTVKKVRTALRIFEESGFIKIENFERYTLITVTEISEEDSREEYFDTDFTENDFYEDDGTDKNTNSINIEETYPEGNTSGTKNGDEKALASAEEKGEKSAETGHFFGSNKAEESPYKVNTKSAEGHNEGNKGALIKEIKNKEYNNIENKRMCEASHTRFIEPDLDEVRLFAKENGVEGCAEKFFYHYQSVGWKIGKTPIADWKAALKKWSVNGLDLKGIAPNNTAVGNTAPNNAAAVNTAPKTSPLPTRKVYYDQRTYDEDELEKLFESKNEG